MADDAKPVDPKPVAPAIHDDVMWDLDKLPDGMLHNLGPEPVKVDTKTEYKRILAERGLRMKDQQESTMGDAEPVIAPPPEPEVRIAPPLTEGHARTMRAFSRILVRYGLREGLHCDVCFESGFPSGARITLNRAGTAIAVRCHCTTRVHRFQTDMSFTPADALTQLDRTEGSLFGADGERLLPTVLIQTDDAKLIRKHYSTLRALLLNNVIVCSGCQQMCEQQIGDHEIIWTCACQIRYWTDTRH